MGTVQATIYLTNTFGVFDTLDADLRRGVHDLLSYEVPNAEHAMRHRPAWDGRRYFLKNNNHFMLGLYPRLHRYLRHQGVQFETVDHRQVPERTEDFRPRTLEAGFDPRPYQREALAIAMNRPRGVFVIGTGGGKSLIAALIVAEKCVSALLVTPNLDLKSQLLRTVETILPGQTSPDVHSRAPVVVTNIQSLTDASPRSLQRFRMLIVDEFHHAAADSYLALNERTTDAYYRYGFTGTFTRTDGTEMEMHGVLSDVIFRKATSDLIEEGYLVRPTVYLHAHKPRGLSYDYKKAYAKVTELPVLNDKIAALAREASAHAKQVLVLVRLKHHGALLADLIPGAIFLNGDCKEEYREEQKARFAARDLRCLIATNIFGEGTDIPSLDVLINARYEKTEVQTKQGVGRALRTAPGKTEAVVHDFLLTGNHVIQAHSLNRLDSYKSEPAFRIHIDRLD